MLKTSWCINDLWIYTHSVLHFSHTHILFEIKRFGTDVKHVELFPVLSRVSRKVDYIICCKTDASDYLAKISHLAPASHCTSQQLDTHSAHFQLFLSWWKKQEQWCHNTLIANWSVDRCVMLCKMASVWLGGWCSRPLLLFVSGHCLGCRGHSLEGFHWSQD